MVTSIIGKVNFLYSTRHLTFMKRATLSYSLNVDRLQQLLSLSALPTFHLLRLELYFIFKSEVY